MQRAQRGDRPALTELVRRYQKPVYALCLRYVHDQDEAADLLQRTFVRVMTKLGDLRSADLFRGWLFRIAANLALNHIRDHARFVSEEATAAGPSTAPVKAIGSDRLEAGQLAAALRGIVSQLPTKQRMTLELRVYEDLSFREIGEALGTSEGAAKVNFHYAIRALRGRIGAADELYGSKERGR
ncbi:MAG TPA: sigma-70 family RNA polymerase sigma factor [Polyangia bacterium]|nr:sigma-70 family RNA polymerase sigma factor [Polyangia bacterium]